MHTKKNLIISLILIVSALATIPTTKVNGLAFPVVMKKVEILYFHYAKRNPTCLNIEKISKETVESQFPDKLKTGEVVFRSINLDEKEGQSLAAQLKIEGQTLVVMSGTNKIDLTDKGMMYATGSPDKLKAEIKSAVESLLK